MLIDNPDTLPPGLVMPAILVDDYYAQEMFRTGAWDAYNGQEERDRASIKALGHHYDSTRVTAYEWGFVAGLSVTK